MTRVIMHERIPTRDDLPHPLGRHILHDSESRRYPYTARQPGRRLTSIRWPRRVPILDQGNLGSCTGNAGVGCLGTDPFYATVSPSAHWHTLNEADAVALYSDATTADGYPGQYPPDDTGSDGLSIAKVLTAAGEIAGYLHAFGLADALAALQTRPLITGVNWYTDMFTPSSTGVVSITGALAGGHEFVVDEYDAVRDMVGCSNSWGTGWGLAGRFYLRTADWGTLLAQQGDVTVFVPANQPAPVPVPPGPTPPAPDDADRNLIADLGHWLTGHHVGENARAQAAVKAWKLVKGL